MTEQERSAIARLAKLFWRDPIAPAQVNDAVAQVVADALSEAVACSTAMNFVPRPTGRPNVSWLVKDALGALQRSAGETKLYTVSCVPVVASRFRTPYEMAKMGL